MYSLRTTLKRGAELLVCKVVAAAPDYSLCDMKQTFQTTALNAQCTYYLSIQNISSNFLPGVLKSSIYQVVSYIL